MKPILVVALGGNALLKRGETLSAENQIKNAAIAAECIKKLHESYRVVIVHGNGPQVGLLALQNAAYEKVPPYSFDILGAETQGMVGYILSQQIKKILPDADVTALITQVEVDAYDPAFSNLTKPIGPVYTEQQKQEHMKQHTDWQFKPDGDYFRRVVASPKPSRIIELDAIKQAIDSGKIVIAAGGGGIPVVKKNGYWRGVEAVIDKDLTAALLAKDIGADAFMILTDGDGVFQNYGKPDQKKIETISLQELDQMEFDPGTMGPKIAAVSNFVKNTAGIAAIGDLSKGIETMEGKAGTRIMPH